MWAAIFMGGQALSFTSWSSVPSGRVIFNASVARVAVPSMSVAARGSGPPPMNCAMGWPGGKLTHYPGLPFLAAHG
jgi:hypothetical protein